MLSALTEIRIHPRRSAVRFSSAVRGHTSRSIAEPHLPWDPDGRVFEPLCKLDSLPAKSSLGLQEPGAASTGETIQPRAPETGTKPISTKVRPYSGGAGLRTRPGCDWPWVLIASLQAPAPARLLSHQCFIRYLFANVKGKVN
jgi:hypothetical protein